MSTERVCVTRVVQVSGEQWPVSLRRLFTGVSTDVIEAGGIDELAPDFPKGRVVLMATNGSCGPVVMTPNQCRRLIAELEMRIRNAESVR